MLSPCDAILGECLLPDDPGADWGEFMEAFIYTYINNNNMQKNMQLPPGITPSPGKGSSAFHVLELAGDGAKLCKTYGELFVPEKRVIIRALDQEPITWKEHNGKATSYSTRSHLPEGLSNEKSGYFDHVHFHMINKVMWPESPMLFGNLHKVLKDGGILFLSGDMNFFGEEPMFANGDTKWISDALKEKFSGVFTLDAKQAMKAAHHMASQYFDVLFALGVGNYAAPNKVLKDVKPESEDVGELFKGESSIYPGFFKLFSNYVQNPIQYSYFLVGKKKEPPSA